MDAGSLLQSDPGGLPSRASLSRSLCLAPGALPWAPKASGHRPLVLAGPPQGRGGAVSEGGALGAGQGSKRSWTKGPSWSGRKGYSKKVRLWEIGCHKKTSYLSPSRWRILQSGRQPGSCKKPIPYSDQPYFGCFPFDVS